MKAPGSIGRLLLLVGALSVLPSGGAWAKRRAKAGGSTRKPAAATTSVAASGKRLAVVSSGPKEASVRPGLLLALKPQKIKTVTGPRVKRVVGTDSTSLADDDWVKAAQKLKVDGFIELTVTEDQGTRSAAVRVRNGSDGSITGQETFTVKGSAKKLASALASRFWPQLGSAVNQTAAPDKDQGAGLPARDIASSGGGGLSSGARSDSDRNLQATPPPSPTATTSGDSTSDAHAAGADESKVAGTVSRKRQAGEAETAGAVSTLDVGVEVRALRHTFDYVPAAAKSSLGFVPVLGGHVSWYPLRNFGVLAAGETSSGLNTGIFPTSTRQFIVAGQFRLPLPVVEIGASAGYFQHAFLIKDTTDPNDAMRLTLEVPNTVYQGVRVAGGAQFPLGSRVRVGAELAYRLVLNAGTGPGQVKTSAYFPNSKPPIGVDANAVVAIRLTSSFEIRGGLDYRRYAYGALQGTTLDGTVINASGAVDQYVVLFVGAAGTFGSR